MTDNGDGPVVVRLDLRSLATLMAGGSVDVPAVGIRIEAGGDAARLVWDVRRRLNGGIVRQKPLPAKDC